MTAGRQPPPGPPEVSEAQLLEVMAAEIYTHLAGLVGLFALPKALQVADRDLQGFARAMAKEQLQLGKEMIPALSDAKAVAELPHIAVRVFKTVDGRPGSAPIKDSVHTFLVQKQFTACQGDNAHAEALSTALLLAFVFTAPVRGLLRLHGYHYDFVSPKEVRPPPIHLVKG